MTEQQTLPRPTIRATPFAFRTPEELRQQTRDNDRAAGFNLDIERRYLDLYWGGYEYSFELECLDTPQKLLAFLAHILGKRWDGATGRNVGRLIRALTRYFAWNLYDAEPSPIQPPTPRTTSAAEERAKLTPSLRYDVLLRDDFRCRACGFSVESGAHLHIDHIRAVSKGGATELNNLQALCSVCNMGKGAR